MSTMYQDWSRVPSPICFFYLTGFGHGKIERSELYISQDGVHYEKASLKEQRTYMALKNGSHAALQKSPNRSFRTDLGLWEERLSARAWRYRIWKNGSLKTMIHKNRRRRGGAHKVMTGPDPLLVNAQWPVGRKEFDERFGGNKWSIPINRVLDLTLP